MAIQLEKHTPHGLTLGEAYVRVTYFHGDSKHVSYRVQTWVTEAARRADAQPIDDVQMSFEYPEKGTGDIVRECYLHLMAQPGFEAAKAV